LKGNIETILQEADLLVKKEEALYNCKRGILREEYKFACCHQNFNSIGCIERTEPINHESE